jgi:uncharacterized protein YbaP (TraB family)
MRLPFSLPFSRNTAGSAPASARCEPAARRAGRWLAGGARTDFGPALARCARTAAAAVASAAAFSAWPGAGLAGELACPPSATSPSPEQLQAIGEKAQDRGFLWRIQKDGRSSYLYGTLHIGRVDWLVPGERTRAALSSADVVAVEIDASDPKVMQAMQQSLSPRGTGPAYGALRKRFEAQLSAACLPKGMLETVAPEVLSSMLVLLSARQDGLDPAFGIDPVLASMGRALGKPVISLETPESQAELLRKVYSASKDNLSAVLHSLEKGQARPMLIRTARVWADSDHHALDNYMSWCECARTRAERQQMKWVLDDRNPELARRVAELHDQGRRVFAAVGSLHLIGPTGLPQLLRDRGFSVHPVLLRAGQAHMEATKAQSRPIGSGTP